jgi:hypothetical protein
VVTSVFAVAMRLLGVLARRGPEQVRLHVAPMGQLVRHTVADPDGSACRGGDRRGEQQHPGDHAGQNYGGTNTASGLLRAHGHKSDSSTDVRETSDEKSLFQRGG